MRKVSNLTIPWLTAVLLSLVIIGSAYGQGSAPPENRNYKTIKLNATIPTPASGYGQIGLDASSVLIVKKADGSTVTYPTSSSGANTALSNLAAVAINTTLVSDTTNTDDLGATGTTWRAGYFGTSVRTPTLHDANNNAYLSVSATASAVNAFTITNAATGNNPTFAPTGTDTNIGIIFDGKGTGVIKFNQAAIFVPPAALTGTTTIATDASLGNFFRVTPTSGTNFTLSNPTNPTDGQTITWEVTNTATPVTITYDTKFAFGADIATCALTATNLKKDFITVKYNLAADKFYVIACTKGY